MTPLMSNDGASCIHTIPHTLDSIVRFYTCRNMKTFRGVFFFIVGVRPMKYLREYLCNHTTTTSICGPGPFANERSLQS